MKEVVIFCKYLADKINLLFDMRWKISFFYEDKRDSLSLYFTGLMYLVVRYHLLGQETKQVNKKMSRSAL